MPECFGVVGYLAELRASHAREGLTRRTADNNVEGQSGMAKAKFFSQFGGFGFKDIPSSPMALIILVKIYSVRFRSVRIEFDRGCNFKSRS